MHEWIKQEHSKPLKDGRYLGWVNNQWKDIYFYNDRFHECVNDIDSLVEVSYWMAIANPEL